MARKPAIADLEARIAELKRELDDERDRVTRMAEHVRDCHDMLDNWKQAFDMVLNDDGVWVWRESFVEGDEWFEKYTTLLREWNKFVPDYNATVNPQPVGRPLAASAAQQARVLKLHKAGKSLRAIADEMTLGLSTVRTIIDRDNGTDRTTRKYLQRIDPEHERVRAWLAKRRTRKALPKRLAEWEKTGRELIKEAKGLK